jgi:hypothetical protein
VNRNIAGIALLGKPNDSPVGYYFSRVASSLARYTQNAVLTRDFHQQKFLWRRVLVCTFSRRAVGYWPVHNGGGDVMFGSLDA